MTCGQGPQLILLLICSPLCLVGLPCQATCPRRPSHVHQGLLCRLLKRVLLSLSLGIHHHAKHVCASLLCDFATIHFLFEFHHRCWHATMSAVLLMMRRHYGDRVHLLSVQGWAQRVLHDILPVCNIGHCIEQLRVQLGLWAEAV